MPIDLEDLAAGYEHRPTSSAARARARRAGAAVHLGPGDLAIDLGGGRGAHAAEWAKSGSRALVVDPSTGMVQKAGLHEGVSAIRATAQQLPLRDSIARLAYFHLSIHYGDWERALAEVKRVLATDGECWIFTMGERHHRSSFLARWFPSVGDIDSARFPDPAAIIDLLGREWSYVEAGTEVESRTMSAAKWRAATEARFVSTLQLVPETEFREGLAAFDETYPDPGQPVEYVLTFDWIRGRK